MGWSTAFAERLREREPLAPRTWFRLGGPARYMLSPRDEEELRTVLRAARKAGVEVAILGDGANLLVSDDGFDGLVIRLDEPAFTSTEFKEDRVIAGAGVELMDLSRECSYRGLSGLEGLAGIPGTLGGAVTMNAGGRFGEIGDVVTRVDLLDRDGVLRVVPGKEMGFGYRCSGVGENIVLRVELALTRKHQQLVKRKFHEVWQFKKDSQPLGAHSAGCIFRNPPGESAGRLIDDAGLKGMRIGGAQVSAAHGNFIVAEEGATAADVLALVEQVRSTVRERTGVTLELEIDVW